MEDALDVEVEDPVPRGRVVLGQRRAPRGTGVVDQHVDGRWSRRHLARRSVGRPPRWTGRRPARSTFRTRDSSATAASTASALREATTTWPRRPRSRRRSCGRSPGAPGHDDRLAGHVEEAVGGVGAGGTVSGTHGVTVVHLVRRAAIRVVSPWSGQADWACRRLAGSGRRRPGLPCDRCCVRLRPRSIERSVSGRQQAGPDRWPAPTEEVVRVPSDTGGAPCTWH